MQKIVFFLFFLTCIVGCIPVDIKPSQSKFTPFYFADVQSRFMGYTYKRSIGQGRCYNCKPILIRDKKVFEMSFNLVIAEGIDWSNPFFVNIKYPNGKERVIMFNENEKKLESGLMYDYYFELHLTNPSKLLLELGYFNETGNSVIDKYNPFKSKTIALN